MARQVRWRGQVLRRFLEHLMNGPMMSAELAAATGEPVGLVANLLRGAVRTGRVHREKVGKQSNRYSITDAGRAYFEDERADHTIRPWPEEKIAFLKRNYGKPGWGTARLAEAVGFSKSATSNKLKALGLTNTRDKTVFWTKEKVAQLCEGYQLGISAAEIAEIVGTTTEAVRSKAYNIGIKSKRAGRRGPQADRAWLNAAPVQEVPATAKPWLERVFGECAYPVCGEGADVWSCCAKVASGSYCDGHKVIMWRVDERSERKRAA